MEPPHGLRNSSLLKAKVLRTGILFVGAQQGGEEPGPPILPPPFSLTCSVSNSRNLSSEGGFLFLLGFLFLFFHKPFSIKPKIFLCHSLKPPHGLTLSCVGFSRNLDPHGYSSYLFFLFLHGCSFFFSLLHFTLMCNFSVSGFYHGRELRLWSCPSLPGPVHLEALCQGASPGAGSRPLVVLMRMGRKRRGLPSWIVISLVLIN